MGLEQIISRGTGPLDGSEEMRINSFLHEPANPGFLAPIQGVTDRAKSTQHSWFEAATALRTASIAIYSAAKTSAGFTFATESMKSEMRGTISDLKREPLKTP